MKRLNTILLGLGLVFLACLVWKTGPGELWRQISALGWGIVLLVLAEGLGNLAHTLGWRCCIARRQRRVGLPRLFGMAMAGYAINYLTPSASVGGEVSRAALLASSHRGLEGVKSVLLDKLMTGIAHLVLVLLGVLLLFWRVNLPVELWIAMAAITGLLACAMAVFVLVQKHGKLGSLCRWLVQHRLAGRSVQQATQRLSEVDAALKQFYREHPRRLMLSVGWHLLGHATVILQVWLFLVLLHQPARLATIAAAGCLSLWFDLLTFAVPMNLGTLEGSRILVFKALGCQALLGMAFGVSVRMAQLFWACFGLLSYARLATGASKRQENGAAAPRGCGKQLIELQPPIAETFGSNREVQSAGWD